MLDIDLTDIDLCAPLLIECWFCGRDHVYRDYADFVAQQKRSNEWMNDADGYIICIHCGIDRYPDLIW